MKLGFVLIQISELGTEIFHWNTGPKLHENVVLILTGIVAPDPRNNRVHTPWNTEIWSTTQSLEAQLQVIETKVSV